MGIVTISHEMGAGGSVIGAALAQRLEYRYVDQDMELAGGAAVRMPRGKADPARRD